MVPHPMHSRKPLVACAVGLVGRTQWRGEGVLAHHSHKGLPSCLGQLVGARKAAHVGVGAKRSKRPHRHGHPAGRPLWWFLVPPPPTPPAPPPPLQGGVGVKDCTWAPPMCDPLPFATPRSEMPMRCFAARLLHDSSLQLFFFLHPSKCPWRTWGCHCPKRNLTMTVQRHLHP